MRPIAATLALGSVAVEPERAQDGGVRVARANGLWTTTADGPRQPSPNQITAHVRRFGRCGSKVKVFPTLTVEDYPKSRSRRLIV
jgi:hypothetical protein